MACDRWSTKSIQSKLFQEQVAQFRIAIKDPLPCRVLLPPPVFARSRRRAGAAFARWRCARCGVDSDAARRIFAICNNLGLLGERSFRRRPGGARTTSFALPGDAAPTRDDFTVFSGVSHPGRGRRASGGQLLPHRRAASGQRRISQYHLARPVHRRAHRPPHPVPVADARRQRPAGPAQPVLDGLRRAHPLRGEGRPRFQAAVPPGHARRGRRRRSRNSTLGESILDAVAGQAQAACSARSAPRDRDRLDQYFTSVRDLEQRMQMSREWERQAQAGGQGQPCRSIPPSPREYMDKVRLMYDMARLAFETDSTRLVTLMLDSVNSPAIEIDGANITDGYHNLSHHGKSEAKLAQLEGHRRVAHEAAGEPVRRLEGDAAKTARRCSTARWSSTAATSATPTPT